MDSTTEYASAHDIKAAVMHHAFVDGQVRGSKPAVPFLAFTGTADTTAAASMTKTFYAAADANMPRGIVNKVVCPWPLTLLLASYHFKRRRRTQKL